jgi:uncharacterized Zn finger protein (UPF0148 family)
LTDRAVPETVIDKIMPMLRSGFDAAHGEARKQTTEARAGWAGVSGERYGSEKAKSWEPPHKEVSEQQLSELKAAVLAAENLYDAAQQEVGSFRGAPTGIIFPCPSCETKLVYDRGNIRTVSEEDQNAHMTKTDERKAELHQAVEDAREKRDSEREALELVERQIEFNEHSDQVKARAAGYHQQVEDWAKCADALAPDGIPGEIIADRIKPLNDRLRDCAMHTGWPQTTVTPTMDILVDNRPFGLQSESSQWRAQAAIAEAISAISGVGLLILDRLDVLDLANRGRLIKWIIGIASSHNNIILIGTLKEAPKLPTSVKVHWLENGEEAA